MDPGESAEETCREALEETGLQVRVTKLIGIYTSPNIMVEYADGGRVQPVSFSFEAEVIGGELSLSDETTEYGYFPVKELDTTDLLEHQKQRIEGAMQDGAAAFYRQLYITLGFIKQLSPSMPPVSQLSRLDNTLNRCAPPEWTRTLPRIQA